ncbi:uncharacterized protein G2W53_022428 [Senna tora]|uniref:Uncharacterized protein n=1 Tax=Senna tora TaxID=362788 RepID=A0A834WP49_9FABA|nr:uncharacterized protein G2W53_022428 [Senna tora]
MALELHKKMGWNKRKIEVDSSLSYKKSKFEIDDNEKEEKKVGDKEKKKVEEIEVTNKVETPKKLCLKIKLKLPPSKTINGELQKKQISELTIVENKEKKFEKINAIDKSSVVKSVGDHFHSTPLQPPTTTSPQDRCRISSGSSHRFPHRVSLRRSASRCGKMRENAATENFLAPKIYAVSRTR